MRRSARTVTKPGCTSWRTSAHLPKTTPWSISTATSARWIREALAELPAREAKIIRERLLEDDARTLESLGRELGVSKERVRQLEARALAKLRRSLESLWRADGNALPDA